MKKLDNILQEWYFHGADDANGTMLITHFVVAGKSFELNFGVTIYVERNKRNKLVSIFLENNEKRKNFLLRSFNITSICKTLSGPNQIFGDIVAFCKAVGMEEKDLNWFVVDENGNKHKLFLLKEAFQNHIIEECNEHKQKLQELYHWCQTYNNPTINCDDAIFTRICELNQQFDNFIESLSQTKIS